MLSVFLCCLTPVHFRSQTYCWEREWGRRCSLTQPVKCFLLTCSTGSNRAGVYSTRANHITAGTASGMDLPSLEAAVQSYYGCGIASSTNRTYNSAKKRFITFCMNYNLSPFPVSQMILCLFVSFLAKEGLQYQSIRAYLSAIRHLYISQGHPDPFAESNFPQLEYVLKGVRRSQGPAKSRERLPITPTILSYLHDVWSKEGQAYEACLLWAACCLGFFTFLWAGEFTSTATQDTASLLTVADITVNSRETPSFLRVFLRRSKTDPFGNGIALYVGRTYHPICPVMAVLSFVARRPHLQGPLFIHEDVSPLTQASKTSSQPEGH